MENRFILDQIFFHGSTPKIYQEGNIMENLCGDVKTNMGAKSLLSAFFSFILSKCAFIIIMQTPSSHF